MFHKGITSKYRKKMFSKKVPLLEKQFNCCYISRKVQFDKGKIMKSIQCKPNSKTNNHCSLIYLSNCLFFP